MRDPLIKSGIDCICLNETFLNNHINNSELQINGYSIIRADCTRESDKYGGGAVMVHVKNSRNCVGIAGSHLCNPHIESLWFRLDLKNAKTTNTCHVYRPPDEFIESLQYQLEYLGI